LGVYKTAAGVIALNME